MAKIDKAKAREIIPDFADAIAKAKKKGAKPAKTVINFRNEKKNGFERDIYEVPIELLRYRKDNGRIRAEVLSYEKLHGFLHERMQEAQDVIRKMLLASDEEKNEELRHSMLQEGQREPAIITADGFLINGNRRKMILETMDKKDRPQSEMKVVILPSVDDEGGPPTLIEVEEIENRYQHQSEAKAEYSNFNLALSISRKIELGLSLAEQLKDDPIYAGRGKSEFDNAVARFQEDYLEPLQCVDRYLAAIGRPGLYNTISTGIGDKEGRWQAFLDYYKRVYKKLEDPKQRMQLGVSEKDVGAIEGIAFKVIRKREFQTLPKAHEIIRSFPKWLSNPDSRKALMKLSEVDLNLEESKGFDKDGTEYDEKTKDKIWGELNNTKLHGALIKARDYYDHEKALDTPISLLESALTKLQDEDLQSDSIQYADIPQAMELLRAIQQKANELETELYHHQKELKALIPHNRKK